jgi:hypothetical protein
MSRPNPASRVRRAGLVFGGAVLGAATLLAVAAGPAAASEDALAPVLTPPTLALDGEPTGEARFETFPSIVPASDLATRARPAGASIAWRATRDPWVAAGLTVAGPAALLLPAVAGMWLPAAASPLALAAGHWYAGDAGRGALVGLGGLGAMGAGAAAGLGLQTLLGAPVPGAVLAGGGLGLGAYTAWAASDAFRLAGGVGRIEAVRVSKR